LGDYVDRGPDSKGVLDIILQLMESGYDVRPVRGNHDDMMLRNFSGDFDMFSKQWLEGWGSYTLTSFGITAPEMIPSKYLTLLDSIPLIQVDDDFVFVHAGLDMTADDPINQTSAIGMLWGEVSTASSKKLSGRKLVTGHTIRPIPLIEISMMTNRIYLDNGAFTNQQPDLGNLVALNLDTMTLIFQPWIDDEALW
jgi:serine/threonine protein phosphatase 1